MANIEHTVRFEGLDDTDLDEHAQAVENFLNGVGPKPSGTCTGVTETDREPDVDPDSEDGEGSETT